MNEMRSFRIIATRHDSVGEKLNLTFISTMVTIDVKLCRYACVLYNKLAR